MATLETTPASNLTSVLKHTITFVEEIHGEAFFCVSLTPSDFESGNFSSVSFGLSLKDCLDRYSKKDFLTDLTTAVLSTHLAVCFGDGE